MKTEGATAAASPSRRRGRGIVSMGRRSWLQVGRFIVFETLVVLGILFLGWESVGRVYASVGATVILMIILDTVFRSINPGSRWITWVLFITDAILAAIIIQMAGGFDGPFAILFFLHSFTAGAFLGVRGGVIIATLDTLLIAAMAFITISGTFLVAGSPLGKLLESLPHEVSLQYSGLLVVINGGFLILTGMVSGYLSEHLSFEQGRVALALDELGKTRAMSRQILESLSDGVLVVDTEGVPISVNRSGMEVLALDEGWRDSVMDTDVYTMLRGYQISGSMPPVVEISLDERIVECRMGVYQDNSGKPAGALVAMTDITETVELKKRLQDQEKLAVVGRLSSTLAHEIRNPLASMSGAAHVLRMGTLEWDKADRMTRLISRQARRISEIIEGYLELSRSRMTRYSEPVSLESVVSEAIEVANQGFGWQVEIDCVIEGNIVVLGSQSRLVQLLTNLMRNSVEALEGVPGGAIQVSLRSGESDGMAELRISDNGPGIPSEILGSIKDPFFTTKKEGTGLGLYVSRRVVDDHQGDMTIRSAPGEGTTVIIQLPLAPPDMSIARTGGGSDG